MLGLLGGRRWGREGVNMSKQCLGYVQDGCSLLAGAGLLAGGGGAGWWGTWIM